MMSKQVQIYNVLKAPKVATYIQIGYKMVRLATLSEKAVVMQLPSPADAEIRGETCLGKIINSGEKTNEQRNADLQYSTIVTDEGRQCCQMVPYQAKLVLSLES